LSRSSLLRNLIPAVIVALVLGSSLVISAGAKDSNGQGQGERDEHCGYGYVQADKDENGNEQGNNNDTKAHGEDNDKCEDEGVEAEGGGDHGDSHIDEAQRAGEREGERGRSG
jgi:hypothetical protein